MHKTPQHPQRQRGSVAVLVAMLLPVFMGISGFAIDRSYAYLVRKQMQNDADAAALAGARRLYNSAGATPSWSMAETTARAYVGQNQADGALLHDATIRSGYWSLSDAVPTLKSASVVPSAYDAPAVEVTLTKTTGVNGGGARTFFLNFWGIHSQPLQVKAVAGISSPGATRIFPFAVSQDLFLTYWNASSLPVGPKNDPATGKPYVFKLTGASGGWADLSAVTNDSGIVSDWLAYVSPVLSSIGQHIWPQPGVKASNYQDVENCSAAGKLPTGKTCEYVYMPVLLDVQAKTSTPILGFACMHILGANQGAKYIQAEMSTQCPVLPGKGVAANYYGAKAPPSLFH